MKLMPCMIGIQMPMPSALAACGRRQMETNLKASRRISMMLLRSAKSGASGKAATNSVTKPNCVTATHT